MRQTNINSLANLKIPKRKKDGHGYQNVIPREKVDELFAHLAEGCSLKKAARLTDICFQTARRYYKEGDTKRGIKPLIHRLEIFQEKISEKMNILLEEQRMDRLSFIRDLIQKAQEVLSKPQKFYNVEGKEIDVYDAEGNKITPCEYATIRDIERLMKLEAFLAGGIKSQETETKFLTADQISMIS